MIGGMLHETNESYGGEKPTLMVIPMIDIIFFLARIFMISTIYTIPQQSLSIMLPKTKTQQSAEGAPGFN